MGLLNIVIRGNDIGKVTHVKLERPMRITYLKINHIYHNLDSFNLSDATDKKQSRLMFVRMGNLLNSADKSITYVGDWDKMITATTNNRYYVDADHTHGFCIGASKHMNSAELVSKEMFVVLHEDHIPVEWNGEFDFELLYLNKEGKLEKWTQSNTYDSSTNLTSTSFINLSFEYHEMPN